jgi:predicted phage tail protein|tara:strand:+ start:5044 stop:5715 length:672 start_codon:yes stop_codon:yes gene_type:complete
MDTLSVKIHTHEEVISFLNNSFKEFDVYTSKIKQGKVDEGLSLVDENFKTLNPNDFTLKKVKDDEVIYVAPCITGGGGKRGFFLMLAIAVVAPYAIGLAAGAGGGFAATYGAGMTSIGTAFSGMTTALGGSGLGASFARSIIGNLALSLISSIFTKKPKAQEQVDSSTRGSDMFGSLQNTTQGGTPVALVYGQTRVAGQFISGYLSTQSHGRSDTIRVGDQFS